MKSTLPDLYTEKDLERARTKGQLLGWMQGAAVGVTGMILLGFIGWLPTIAVAGIGGFALYKLLARSPGRD
jgi:hypothetical protein